VPRMIHERHVAIQVLNLSVSQGGRGGGGGNGDDDSAARFGGRFGDLFLAAALLVVRKAVCGLENPAPSGVAGSGSRGVVGFFLPAPPPDSRPPKVIIAIVVAQAVASTAPIACPAHDEDEEEGATAAARARTKETYENSEATAEGQATLERFNTRTRATRDETRRRLPPPHDALPCRPREQEKNQLRDGWMD
jgi:hypothetical protein